MLFVSATIILLACFRKVPDKCLDERVNYTNNYNPIVVFPLFPQTPLDWQSRWEGPEDPIQYLRTLVARTMAIQGWVQKAESRSLLNETLDLSELFHPDTFLNALRQLTAR